MLKWEKALSSGFYYKLLEQEKVRPDDIEPNILPFQFYIDAYHELSTCRYSGGMGLTPIPFTSIVEYCTIYRVDDFDEFLYIIRLVDRLVLNKDEAKSGSSKNKNNNNKGRGNGN